MKGIKAHGIKKNGKFYPPDFKTFVRKKIAKRLTLCFSLLLIFGAVLYFFGERIFNSDIPEFNISGYVLAMLIPFAVSGVPFKLIDSTFCGTIIDTEYNISADSASSAKPTHALLYWKKTIILKLQTPNGKIIRRKVFEHKAIDNATDAFKIGDQVFHLYGAKHTVILPKSADTHIQCPVCGDMNSIDSDKCRSCGHTLIKSLSEVSK